MAHFQGAGLHHCWAPAHLWRPVGRWTAWHQAACLVKQGRQSQPRALVFTSRKWEQQYLPQRIKVIEASDGETWPPKDDHPNPRTREDAMFHGEEDFADVIEVPGFATGMVPWMAEVGLV